MLPATFRARARTDRRLAAWIWSLFGISETKVVNRDYRHLLDGLQTLTAVLVGGIELGEPRDIVVAASAASEGDRAAYRAHAAVHLMVVAGVGHLIAKYAGGLVVRTLRNLLDVVPKGRGAS